MFNTFTNNIHKVFVDNDKRPAVILMQGCPGSAKSTLAGKIKEYVDSYFNDDVTAICSADGYFMVGDKYVFNRDKLAAAHLYCKSAFYQSVMNRCPLIIVDNTNVDLKSIRNYYDPDNGYRYAIVRPNTPWYFDAEECFKKNTHNVPLDTIERMINSIKKFSLEDVKADILWI
jgi:predicted kinase